MTLSTLLRLARPYHWQLVLLTALMLAEALVTLIVPWFIGQLAGNALTNLTGTDWRLIVLVIALLAGAGAARAGASTVAGAAGLRVLTDLRARIHDHVIGLPLAFHHASHRGDLMALMTWEVGRLADYLTGTIVAILPALVTAIGAIIIMSRLDPLLTLIVPVVIPLFIILARLTGRRLRRISGRVQQAEAAVMASAEQTLGILPAVKTFTREAATAHDYRDRLETARRAGLAELMAHAVVTPVSTFITSAAALVLLGLAGDALARGGLTAASMISFLLYAALLTRPLSELASVWGRTQVARGVLARLSTVLDVPIETGGTRRLSHARGAITVRDLHFAYPGRPPVLTGLSLDVAAGEIVALTGANGAGKSTLTALMMGLMQPDAGVITLDGHDIAMLDLHDLRRQFGHVPQRPLLFNGTIRDNIAFGHPDADEARIAAAARAAQAEDFIHTLPDGYDTVIGDDGVRLSGGQSQRVALARALIKEPPVLILDEATAMYDLEGESAFVAAALTALKGRTVILITHRPATLALAQRILRLDGGQLEQVA